MARISALLMLLVLPACVSPETHRNLQAANDVLQRQLADLKLHQEQLESENRGLRDAVGKLGKNAVEADFLEQQKKRLQRLIDRFKAGGVDSRIQFVQQSNGLAVRVPGEILFASGKAELTREGKTALTSLLPTLKGHEKGLRIDGHTDSDPIRHSRWKTNLRLSAERAMAVYDFLKKSGISPDRMWIGAFGEHRPLAKGTSSRVKRVNRRVEILMLEGG